MLNVLVIPKSKGHCIKTTFHLTEERTGGFHLEAVLLAGVPLINSGSEASISGLVGKQKDENKQQN